MKAFPDKKPGAPQPPTGDRPGGNPPRVDPPTEPAPVDEIDVPTPAVEAQLTDD